jgi:hypothetical protein
MIMRSSAGATTNPMPKQPVTLITNVPHGNVAGSHRWIAPPSR